MNIPLPHVIAVSAILFSIGIYGALTRRNAIGILICIELVLNSANLNFIAFAQHTQMQQESAQIFVLIVMGVAAAGAVVGLALVLAIFRHRQTIHADEINLLKG